MPSATYCATSLRGVRPCTTTAFIGASMTG